MSDQNNYELYSLGKSGQNIKEILNFIQNNTTSIEELIKIKEDLNNIINEYKEDNINGRIIDGGTY